MKYFVTIGEREVEVVIDGEMVTVEGRTFAAHQTRIAGTPLHQVSLDGRSILVELERTGRGRWEVSAWGERHEATVLDERARHIQGLVRQAEPASKGSVIRAPMPGLVLRVPVEPGAQVSPGQGVLVLEAMKMENEIKAPTAGVVESIQVKPGQAVEKGEVLLRLGALGAQ